MMKNKIKIISVAVCIILIATSFTVVLATKEQYVNEIYEESANESSVAVNSLQPAYVAYYYPGDFDCENHHPLTCHQSSPWGGTPIPDGTECIYVYIDNQGDSNFVQYGPYAFNGGLLCGQEGFFFMEEYAGAGAVFAGDQTFVEVRYPEEPGWIYNSRTYTLTSGYNDILMVESDWVDWLNVKAGSLYRSLVGEEIQFNGLAFRGYRLLGDVSWHWDFGDGNTSNEQNPIHNYFTEGNYTATLTVTDSYGYFYSDTAQVVIISEQSYIWVDDDFTPDTPGWGIDHFDSIQDGINASTHGDIVYVSNGIYYETITLNKSIDLIGEDKNTTIIDCSGVWTVVYIASYGSVLIEGFTIQNGGDWGGCYSIEVYTDNNIISGNIVRGTWGGICFIYEDASYNIVSGNIITQNGGGIEVWGLSSCNTISRNIINDNNLGLFLVYSPNSNMIYCNTFENNGCGISGAENWVSNNHIYHNNFINNGMNAQHGWFGYWDDGYPSGGNYWDDYNGSDNYHGPGQNISGGDGIGDTPYDIPPSGFPKDRYPLMGPWTELPVAYANGPYIGSVNVPLQFTGFAYGGYPPYNWSWDFGDGTNSTLQYPTHNYTTASIYTVNLTVTDSNGNSNSNTTIATIKIILVDANGPYTGFTNEPVQFNGSVYGGISPYNWTWDFGDGNTSNFEDPANTYTTTGIYTANLTVTDSENNSDSDTAMVTIREDHDLVGYWHFDEGSGSTTYDSSGNENHGAIHGASWTDGILGSALSFDGIDDYVNIEHSAELAPTSEITVSGWAYVDDWSDPDDGKIVSKTQAGGYNLGIDSGSISFVLNRNGVYATPGFDITNLDIGWHHFAGTYDDRYTKLYVDGDLKDTDDAGGIYPISYSYDNALIIGQEASGGSSPEGIPFDGIIDEVRIYSRALNNSEIQALLYGGPLNVNTNGPYVGLVNESIPFNGSAYGGILPYSWYWDFGNGDNSTDQNPTYAYNEVGVYTVILTVEDNEGNIAQDDTTATIADELVADADGPYEGLVNEPVQFYGNASGGFPPYTYYWDFDDGETSEYQNPIHTYEEPGIYEVTLCVEDDEGNIDCDTTIVTIYGGPNFVIKSISGGFGISADIENAGDMEASDIEWSIVFNGGVIFLPRGGIEKGNIDSISAGGKRTINTIPFGIGGLLPGRFVDITILANALGLDPVEVTVSTKLLLFFVILQ